MAKTSFTVHLDAETAQKIEQMKEENPDFSRNALIRLAVKEFPLGSRQEIDWSTTLLDRPHTHLHDKKYESYMIRNFKLQINALHKRLNPDWKRKKSLPYHFPEEYNDVANYTEFHGE
tara:strand:- start:2584 stop:2937 length:354 start_codon:yes stop_codon:yes gene_type:complete